MNSVRENSRSRVANDYMSHHPFPLPAQSNGSMYYTGEMKCSKVCFYHTNNPDGALLSCPYFGISMHPAPLPSRYLCVRVQ